MRRRDACARGRQNRRGRAALAGLQDHGDSGDVGPIVIGQRVNVQDGAIIHCDTGITNHREDDVSIAHGAVVTPGTIVPDRHLVVGVPAKVIRPLKDEELKYLRWVPQRCILLANEWIDGKGS